MPRPATPTTAPTTLRRAGAATVAAAALVLSGCSSDPEETPVPSTSPTPSTAAPSTPVAVELPSGTAGEQAAWVLDRLVPGAAQDEAEIVAHVAPSMLEQVSAAQLVEIFTSLSTTGPWTVVAAYGEGDAAALTIVDTVGTFLDVQIAVDEDGLVFGLLFQPGSDPTAALASSWDELDAQVAALGVDAAVLVSRVADDGTTTPVHTTGDPDGVLPLGSVFKLYVLGAVAEAVESGELAWDTPLTVTDAVRSLPSGTLQDAPTGTVVTVEEAATGMIAISDNTATDLLVATVGRDAVVQASAAMGHHDPSLNDPFLTTRDLFWLGWGADGAGDDWGTLDAAARAAVLAAAPEGLVDVAPEAMSVSRWQDGLDWFATPHDLLAAHVALQEHAATPAGEPVGQILSANPGIPVDATAWPYVAFKGGSAPGVLAGSWYARAADGGTVVVTVQLASTDPAGIPPTMTFVHLAQSALALV